MPCRPPYNRPRTGFTLVELLIVIGIIAVLVAILLPVMGRVRKQALVVQCQSNLRQIGNALLMYSYDNKDRYPDPATLGGSWTYRRAPGVKNKLDPSSYPEWMGLAAVLSGIRVNDYDWNKTQAQVEAGVKRDLQSPKYLAGDSKVWVCQGAKDEFQDYGNTYSYSLAMNVYTSSDKAKLENATALLVWDNWASRPFIPGSIASSKNTNGYAIPQGNRVWPHRAPPYAAEHQEDGTPPDYNHIKGDRGVNFLRMDNSVVLQFKPN